MTRNELNTYLAAILTTLAEVDGGCAESTVYIALGMDIHKYNEVREILVVAQLVAIDQCNWMKLTAKGREIADKCNAFIAAAKANT